MVPLQVPYRLVEGTNGNVKIKSSNAGKDFAPEEISALVLRKLTDDAAKFLNDKVLSYTTPATGPVLAAAAALQGVSPCFAANLVP